MVVVGAGFGLWLVAGSLSPKMAQNYHSSNLPISVMCSWVLRLDNGGRGPKLGPLLLFVAGSLGPKMARQYSFTHKIRWCFFIRQNG